MVKLKKKEEKKREFFVHCACGPGFGHFCFVLERGDRSFLWVVFFRMHVGQVYQALLFCVFVWLVGRYVFHTVLFCSGSELFPACLLASKQRRIKGNFKMVL